MTQVMAGIRILEVAEHTFVPAASALLADWGADVIKIEHVERGDAMRGLMRTGVIPTTEGGVHALLEHSNRGKRSIGVDLTKPEGVELIYKLAALSDVFLTNKLPHVRAALQIDEEDIRKHNPNIIYVRGTGYGSKGPDADKGGYDILGYWARSGLAVGATPADSPVLMSQPGPAYGDSIGAMTIAGGISAALLHRERTGEAPTVDVSLLGTGMWAGGAGIALSHQLGIAWQHPPAQRTGMMNPLTNSYKTADDKWLFISCLQGFHYWPELCRVIDRPDLVTDERFNTSEGLMANAFEASQVLDEVFAQATLDEWRARMDDFKGQWSPVQSNIEVTTDPQVLANDYIVHAETAEGHRFPLVASPVQFNDRPSQPHRAPDFNEHGDAILTEDLGLDMDAVIDLRLKGVVA